MRYFTKQWCCGELSDREIHQRLIAYNEHISSIYNSLPFVIKIRAKHISLHDGIIHTIQYSKERLVIGGIFGDLEVGYFDALFTYEMIHRIDFRQLQKLFHNKHVEILSDEIEANAQTYSHTIFFASHDEITICFEKITLQIKNVNKELYRPTVCKVTKFA